MLNSLVNYDTVTLMGRFAGGVILHSASIEELPMAYTHAYELASFDPFTASRASIRMGIGAARTEQTALQARTAYERSIMSKKCAREGVLGAY